MGLLSTFIRIKLVIGCVHHLIGANGLACLHVQVLWYLTIQVEAVNGHRQPPQHSISQEPLHNDREPQNVSQRRSTGPTSRKFELQQILRIFRCLCLRHGCLSQIAHAVTPCCQMRMLRFTVSLVTFDAGI